MKSYVPLLILIGFLTISCSQNTQENTEENTIEEAKVKIPEVIEKDIPSFVYGIDISHHQGYQIESINKQTDSIDFIIFKATEGITYVDPYFSKNWNISKEKSLIRGAYHFYRSDDDPSMQATHFIQTISDIQNTDIPPIVDFEEGGIDDSQSIENIRSALMTFLIEIENKTSAKPIIYTNTNTGNKYLKDPFFADYPLWIANYTGKTKPAIPKAWKNNGWVFWQRSDSYVFEGTTDDFDKFNGNLTDLLNFIKNSYSTE